MGDQPDPAPPAEPAPRPPAVPANPMPGTAVAPGSGFPDSGPPGSGLPDSGLPGSGLPDTVGLARRRRAPAVTRADLVGALSIASLVSLLGVPLGWLWSRLAPPQLSLVQDDGSLVPLPTESQHRFDDLATFVLLGAVAGVLAGVAVWLMRRRRGPLAVLGLAAGSLVAAWLAARTGLSFAEGRYPSAIAGAAAGDVVAAPPRLDSMWVIIVQPLAAAIAYGTAAAANGLDDLGRRGS